MYEVTTAATADYDTAEYSVTKILVPADSLFCGNDIALAIIDANVSGKVAEPMLDPPDLDAITAIGYGTTGPSANERRQTPQARERGDRVCARHPEARLRPLLVRDGEDGDRGGSGPLRRRLRVGRVRSVLDRDGRAGRRRRPLARSGRRRPLYRRDPCADRCVREVPRRRRDRGLAGRWLRAARVGKGARSAASAGHAGGPARGKTVPEPQEAPSPAEPAATTTTDGGCSSAPGSAAESWPLALLAAVFIKRRRRSH